MSCCTCGNNCGPGCGCLYQVVLPDNPVLIYTAANINTLGIGVYDSTAGNEFDFRGIYSGNTSIVVALDAGNNAISITLNIDQIIDDLPQATTTQRGVGETATDAEAIAKASITTFLTPSNLAALGASNTFAGLVETATIAETQALASGIVVVTPLGLGGLVSLLKQTTTFADNVARAAATPGFDGQLASQLDTNTAWVGSGLAAGNWNPLFTFNTTNTVIGNTVVGMAAFTINFTGGGALTLESGTGLTVTAGDIIFQTGNLSLGGPVGSEAVDLFDVVLSIGSVQVPAASVLTTSGLATPNSLLLNTFLSTSNVQTGWAVTNPVSNRTLDVAAATLGQVREVLGSLITDLKAVLLPAT